MKTIYDYTRTNCLFTSSILVALMSSVLVLFTLAMLIVGCTPTTYTTSPLQPNDFTSSFDNLDNQTVYQLEEIENFAIGAYHLPVSTIRFNVLKNQLLIASEGSSQIVGWDVKTEELVLKTNVQLPHFKSISFDKEGKLLLGAVDSGPENMNGIGIWNVENGKLIQCVSYPCDETAIRESYGYPGAVFDPDAEYVITFDNSSYGITEILGSGFDGGTNYVNNPDEDYLWSLGNIALDTNNNRLAVVFQEGQIWLDEFNRKKRITIGPLGLWIPIAKGRQNDLQTIYAANFDESGQWLAIVRGNHLLIYQVWKYGGKLVSENDLGQEGLRTLSFNPTSELLFVAGEDTIKVISLKDRKDLVDLPASGITAITVSDDNRLLIWGDKEGTVHIWVVLEK
jgi:WD40 repeat protein